VALVRSLPLQWYDCCDDNGDSHWLRKSYEPSSAAAGKTHRRRDAP
jgi:hypothetical protein